MGIYDYFNTDGIIEIYSNRGHIWVEHFDDGKRKTNIEVSPEDINLLNRIIAGTVNKEINKSNLFLATDIPDLNARFQGASDARVTPTPFFIFRLLSKKVVPLEDYLEKGRLTQLEYDYLIQAIIEEKNIVVSGGTGSGKTTFTGALAGAIAQHCPSDRILLLEDTPELQILSEDFQPLHTYNAKIIDESEDMQSLIFHSLRSSPDRIIIGEVRDRSAYDMLKAWNTGHKGGICTLHADDAELTLRRIENLCRENPNAGDVRSLIGEAVNVVVSLRKKDKQQKKSYRGVNSILELHDFDYLKQKYDFTKIS